VELNGLRGLTCECAPQERTPLHEDGSPHESLERTQAGEDRPRRTGEVTLTLLLLLDCFFFVNIFFSKFFFQEIQPEIGGQLSVLFPLDESVDVHLVARRIRHKRRTPSEPRPRGRPPQREPGRLANHQAPPPASCSSSPAATTMPPAAGRRRRLLPPTGG